MAVSTGFSELSAKVAKYSDVNSAAASIDQITAVTGKKIRIIAGVIHTSAAGALIFNSASTAIGRYTSTAGELTITLPWNPDGWFQTVAGEKFNIGNAGTVTLTGFLTYVEV